MLYIFVAVLAVLLVMNVFMLLVLRQMLGATGRQIEKDAGRLLGTYDAMLEKKSRRLEELQKQEEELLARMKAEEGKERAHVPERRAAAPKAPAEPAKFQEKDFSYLYGRIKETFSVEGETLAREFQSHLTPETEQEALRRRTLEEMRRLLDFDSLYELTVLPPAQQRQVLEQVFTGDSGSVYREWEETGGGMDALAFSEWLDMRLQEVSRHLTVKTAPGRTGERSLERKEGQDTVWKEDDSICEGVKLRYQNRLYDYSV